MDRFFSKLDLRDIKIKPEGSRFLPDDDEVVLVEEPPVAPIVTNEEVFGLPETDSSNYNDDDLLGHVVTASYEHVTVTEWEAPAATDSDTLPSVAASTDSNAEVLKVSAKSRPSAVAGAIAGVVRENGHAEVQAIGAGATNQAIKAVAIAREYLLETDIDAVCIPAFIDVMIDNEERTAIRLVVEQR